MPGITIRGKHAIVLFEEDGITKSRIMKREVPPQNPITAEGGATENVPEYGLFSAF